VVDWRACARALAVTEACEVGEGGGAAGRESSGAHFNAAESFPILHSKDFSPQKIIFPRIQRSGEASHKGFSPSLPLSQKIFQGKMHFSTLGVEWRINSLVTPFTTRDICRITLSSKRKRGRLHKSMLPLYDPISNVCVGSVKCPREAILRLSLFVPGGHTHTRSPLKGLFAGRSGGQIIDFCLNAAVEMMKVCLGGG